MIRKYTPIVVCYRLKFGKKAKIKIFDTLRCPDPIITNRSTKLPEGAEILEIGVGRGFENTYRKKYKI